jgi:hypothetical protein
MGGLQADPHRPAGAAERLRHVDHAVVADNGLRHDHRPRGRVLQPLIYLRQPAVRQHRPGHAQRVRPPWPHRLRGHRAGQQQRRVHRLGRRPQHRRRDRPRGQVDDPAQLDPVDQAVVQHHPHVQRRGIDLGPLAWAHRGDRAERPVRPLGQRPAGAGRSEGVPARRDLPGQPVERRPGRHHRRRVDAVLAGQDLLHPPPQPGDRPGGPVRLLRYGLLNRLQDTLIGPGTRPAGGPVVDQAPDPPCLIGQPLPLERAQRHLVPAPGQLADLGQLPLPQRARGQIVLRPGPGPFPGLRRDAGDHLDDVTLPPARLVHRLRGKAVQQPLRGQRGRRPRHHPEPRRAEQFRQRDAGLGPGHIDQPDPGPGQAGDRVRGTVDQDLVAGPQRRRP